MSMEKLTAKLYQLQADLRNTPIGQGRLRREQELLLKRFADVQREVLRDDPKGNESHLMYKLLAERVFFWEVEAQFRERVLVHFIALLAESLGEAKLNEVVKRLNAISLDDVMPEDRLKALEAEPDGPN
jgi:hypothetical protein